jgi:hypothetical protein
MVRLLTDEIEDTGADLREVISALTLKFLIRPLLEGGDVAEVSDATVMAAVGLIFRGNSRILCTRHVLPFLVAMRQVGFTRAWERAVELHLFRHVDLPILPELRLDLNAMSQNTSRSRYRFDQDQLKAIAAKLPFPEVLITYQRDKFYLVEGLCILLHRMAYPVRWSDMEQLYGRHVSAMSRIFAHMLRLILERALPSILLYPPTAERVEACHQAFVRHGVPADMKISHILDGKKTQNCRPTTGQRSQYCSYKKGHGYKFQTLEGPDGITHHCSNPSDGRRSDPGMLRDSNLCARWRTHPILRDYKILADSAYPNNDCIIALYKKPPNAPMPPLYQLFNSSVSKERVAVEWGYARIVNLWAFIDFKKNLKMMGQNVEAFWHLACWLTNLHTCVVGGNQTSQYFGLKPPTLDEFIDATLH